MSQGSPQASRKLRLTAVSHIAVLFDEHARMVLAICRTLLRDPDDAEDASQQTFLSAYRALLNGTRPVDAPAWLATIARNECRARIHATAAKPRPVPLCESVTESRAATDPEGEASRREQIAAFTAALEELPERQREAVILRDVHGLSYGEVASAMRVSPPAVESLLSRGRRMLEARMRPVRVVQGAPLVIDALRGRLEALIPGLASTEATAVVASSAGGLLGKLISAQVVTKVAATSAVAVVTLGVGSDVAGDLRQEQRRSAVAPPVRAESLAQPASTSRVQAVAATRRGATQTAPRIAPARKVRADKRTESVDSKVVIVHEDTAVPAAEIAPVAAAEENGHHGSQQPTTEAESINSGPGSVNSGPGSTSSGSGSSGSTGPGSDDHAAASETDRTGTSAPEFSENSGPGSQHD